MIGVSNILLIFVWGISVPFVLGMLWEKRLADSDHICFARNFALGFMTMAAVFQVLAVPAIFLRAPFHVLKDVWITIIVCLLVISAVINFKDLKKRLKNSIVKKPERTELLIWLAVIAIVAFQTCLLAGQMHVDTDDARFIAEAMEAVEKDTMLQYHPLTGEFLGSPLGEMNKDVTSPYPIFLGLAGELFDLPPAVAAHVILPVLLIPLCYAVYFVIGNWFFDGDSRHTGLFLLFLGLIHMFSFESIYASGYTLLTIIWQGRSVAAMILLPLLWYVLLRMTGQAAVSAKDYVLLTVVLIACAMLSGMGLLLSLLMALTYACVCGWQKRSLRTAFFMLLCMGPNIVNLIISRYLL